MTEKYNVLKGMNSIVLAMNNEEAYMEWIQIVPDGADDEDLQYCASDDELFAECVLTFKDICKRFMRDGLYIDKQLY